MKKRVSFTLYFFIFGSKKKHRKTDGRGFEEDVSDPWEQPNRFSMKKKKCNPTIHKLQIKVS